MIRRWSLALCVIGLSSVFVQPLHAQDEKKFGVGLDVQNQSFELVSFGATGQSPFFTLGHTSLTPAILVSYRSSPNLFIEPSFGFHRSKDEVITSNTGGPSTTETEITRDISVGLGVLWLSNPTGFVSPLVHGTFNVHFLKFTDDDEVFTVFPTTTEVDAFEVTATAFALSAGFGGIVTINDAVFITVEGRLIYASVGDAKESLSGPFATGFADNTDTSSSIISTDMVIGVRVLFN